MYYVECLPLSCAMLLRKTTLGCLPRKTLLQGTLVGQLEQLSARYLYYQTGIEVKKLWNYPATRPQTAQEAWRRHAFEFSLQTSAK